MITTPRYVRAASVRLCSREEEMFRVGVVAALDEVEARLAIIAGRSCEYKRISIFSVCVFQCVWALAFCALKYKRISDLVEKFLLVLIKSTEIFMKRGKQIRKRRGSN